MTALIFWPRTSLFVISAEQLIKGLGVLKSILQAFYAIVMLYM